MDTFGSPIPFFEYNELDFDNDKTNDELVEVKTEVIEVKEENCEAYSAEDIQSSNNEGTVANPNIDSFSGDLKLDAFAIKKLDAEFFANFVNIAENFKKSDLICEECNKEFDSVPHLKRHIREQHRERKCPQCDFITNSFLEFRRHNLMVHKKVLYKCPNCDYRTPKKDLLKKHEMLKTQCQIRVSRLEKLSGADIPKEFCLKEDNGFKCIYCKFNSSLPSRVKKHFIAVHLQLKIFSCFHCEFKATCKSTIDSHMSCKHPEKCDPSQLKHKVCHLCGKTYSMVSALNKHIRSVHLNEKQKCTLCDYVSVKQYDLVCHMRRVHEPEKLFKCHDCGYTSPKKFILKEHILGKHLKLEEHRCDVCSFKTYYRNTLKVHKKLHDNPKVLACEYCSYTTFRRKALEVHTRGQHTRDSLLECNQCDYKTTAKYLLIQHVDVKHNKIDYFVCQVCGKYRSKYERNVVSHMHKAHGRPLTKIRRKLCPENPNLDIDDRSIKKSKDQTKEKLKKEDCKEQIKQEINENGIETVYVTSVLVDQENSA